MAVRPGWVSRLANPDTTYLFLAKSVEEASSFVGRRGLNLSCSRSGRVAQGQEHPTLLLLKLMTDRKKRHSHASLPEPTAVAGLVVCLATGIAAGIGLTFLAFSGWPLTGTCQPPFPFQAWRTATRHLDKDRLVLTPLGFVQLACPRISV